MNPGQYPTATSANVCFCRILLSNVYRWRKSLDPNALSFSKLILTIKGLVLFLCLYSRSWRDPPLCNSSHSRLLGFFTTLPGIWRGIQCIRRYYDTRNVFPHLVNGGKYTFTILYYMTLSLYRVHKSPQLRALFIACASVNAIYCCKFE